MPSLVPGIHAFFRGWPGHAHGCPVQLFVLGSCAVCTEFATEITPWPGLTRPSTSSERRNVAKKDVGGRVKPGHGALCVLRKPQHSRLRIPGQPCVKAVTSGNHWTPASAGVTGWDASINGDDALETWLRWRQRPKERLCFPRTSTQN